MTGGLLTDRRELEELFDELAAELTRLDEATAEVVMVGGAWMLWHAQRASTRDVDSARRLSDRIRGAIDGVGAPARPAARLAQRRRRIVLAFRCPLRRLPDHL